MNTGSWRKQFETTTTKVRNVLPIKINEVRLNTSTNPTDQFIELYNASNSAVDISNWTLVNTQSQWAPVKLASIPAGTKLASGAYYLLGLSNSGLSAPATSGSTNINVRSTTGFANWPTDRYRWRDSHHQKCRNCSHGNDDRIHASVHGAVDHDSGGLDQPACCKRRRFRRWREDRNRHRRQLTNWPQ